MKGLEIFSFGHFPYFDNMNNFHLSLGIYFDSCLSVLFTFIL